MNYEVPSHDTLLNDILTDYQNIVDKDGNPIDISKGSLVFIDSAVLASALQGIYFRLKYTEQQSLANLSGATSETIKKWAGIFGVDIDSTDNDADIVQNIITRIQQPPAGGNENDWLTWADSISVSHTNSDGTTWSEETIDASVIENIRSDGSVDLFLLSDWTPFPEWSPSVNYIEGDIVQFTCPSFGTKAIFECSTNNVGQEPNHSVSTSYWELLEGCSHELSDEAQSVIEDLRPIGIWDTAYQSVAIDQVVVIGTISGNVSKLEIEELVRSYINSLEIGKNLSRAKLYSLLDEAGCETALITSPSSDIIGVKTEKIMASVVTLTLI